MKQMDLERAVQFVISGQEEMEKLNQLVGLSEFKHAMLQVMSVQKRKIIAHSRGRQMRPVSFHMCFLGNPGTGKTEMSRKAAHILHKAGVVEKETLLVAGRSDLVGEHVGETAIKTKALIKKACGGVLLIDEAYALMDDREGSYGDEAINTLVEEMESCRSDLVIIFAGYPDRMKRFLANNPGLQSRIPYTINFPDYTSDQLYRIAEKFAAEDGYYFRNDVKNKLISIFDIAKKDPEFGNARYARNLIEKAEAEKAEHIEILDLFKLSDDDLFQLTPDNFSEITSIKAHVIERRIGF